MEHLIFRCQACGAKLRIPASHRGKRVRCPKCGTIGSAPSDQPPTPSPSPEAQDQPTAWFAGEDLIHDQLTSAPGIVTSPTQREARSAARGGIPLWVWVAGGSLVGLVVIGVVAFLLWPRSEPQPAASVPPPQMQEPAPPAPPPPPAPEKIEVQTWYARFIPRTPAVLISAKLGRILQSQVVREGTAPVSALLQLAMLQLQQQAGAPLTAIEELVVAFVPPDQGTGPDERVPAVAAMRSSVPFNREALLQGTVPRQLDGETVYGREADETQQQLAPAVAQGVSDDHTANALAEVLANSVLWLPDDKTAVLASEELMRAVIARADQTTLTFSGDLARAIAQVDPLEQADLVIVGSDEYRDALPPMPSASAVPNVRATGPNAGVAPAGPGATGVAPPGGVPGGLSGPPSPPVQQAQPAQTTAGLPPLPTGGALAVTAKVGSTLDLRMAFVTSDEASAGQALTRLSALRQQLMFLTQGLLQQQQQQLAALQQDAGSAQGGANAQASPQEQTLRRIVSGLEKLRDALNQATIEGEGTATVMKISLSGEAIAALILLALQQQEQQQQQPQPGMQPGFPPGLPGFFGPPQPGPPQPGPPQPGSLQPGGTGAPLPPGAPPAPPGASQN